jgi:putative endonuclease
LRVILYFRFSGILIRKRMAIQGQITMWYVYILRCSDNSLYPGITTDPGRRLGEHNEGGKKASKYTRSRLPVELVYLENFRSKESAFRRESRIKKLAKKEKEALVETSRVNL